ncbi:MAG: Fic family protein [Methanomassiliicoccales archaeon]|jgi:Fic family protein
MNQNILHALRSVLLERTSLTGLPDGVWKELSVINTHGTNAIEGNALTLEEVRTVLTEGMGVAKRTVRELRETIQHDEAFRSLPGRLERPLDPVTVLELHEQVFRGILPDAGQWRRVNVLITGAKHRPPRMEKVPDLVVSLLEGYNRKDVEGEDVFELASFMHCGFESVHPFIDGNGRIGRLLLNHHLMRRNWPPVSLTLSDRKEYYQALTEGDENDYARMTGLLTSVMSRSLLTILDSVGTKDDELLPLKDLEKISGLSAKYLSLRAGQRKLPALMTKGEYLSSRRACSLYKEFVGRS